jgi:hypothetical protein
MVWHGGTGSSRPEAGALESDPGGLVAETQDGERGLDIGSHVLAGAAGVVQSDPGCGAWCCRADERGEHPDDGGLVAGESRARRSRA